MPLKRHGDCPALPFTNARMPFSFSFLRYKIAAATCTTLAEQEWNGYYVRDLYTGDSHAGAMEHMAGAARC